MTARTKALSTPSSKQPEREKSEMGKSSSHQLMMPSEFGRKKREQKPFEVNLKKNKPRNCEMKKFLLTLVLGALVGATAIPTLAADAAAPPKPSVEDRLA